MGGIGEVCTREAHRGQGIAKRLLQMAVAYMEAHAMPLASLHAGPSAAGLYQRLGFRDIPVSLCACPREALLELCESLDPGPSEGRPRVETTYGDSSGGAGAGKPAGGLPWEQMARMHAAYTRDLNGCVVRGVKGQPAEACVDVSVHTWIRI